MAIPATGPGNGGRRHNTRGARHGGRGRRQNNRPSGQARAPSTTISKRDSAITAAFPAGYEKSRIEALKIPAGGNQGARLVTTCNTLGTLARATGTAGASYAATEIETGVRHVFVPVADSALNPYRIAQDFLVATGPQDYFKDVSDDEADATGTDATDAKPDVESLRAKLAGVDIGTPRKPKATDTGAAGGAARTKAPRKRPLRESELKALGPYRMMTPAETAVAPLFKEMSPDMAKNHVLPSKVIKYAAACKAESDEVRDYDNASRTIFTRLLALLPETAVDSMKAREDWLTIDMEKNLSALRNAAMAGVSNADTRLYTALQACRSTRATFTARQRGGETTHEYYERCMTNFHAHNEAGHGWPVDAHYKEVVGKLAKLPDHDRSLWVDEEPGVTEANALYEACVEALKAMVFIEGLSDACKEYKARLENAYAEGNDIYPKRTATAKERVMRHRPAAPAQQAAPPYAGDPVALAFATAAGQGIPLPHSLQGDTPYYNADGSFTCFICKQTGHKAKDCPNRPTAATAATTTTTAAPAAGAPAPTATQTGAPAWGSGVPINVTFSAPPASAPAKPDSNMSAITNTTRGLTGGARQISNAEIYELISAARDNGDGTSSLLFATVSQIDAPDDDPPEPPGVENAGTSSTDASTSPSSTIDDSLLTQASMDTMATPEGPPPAEAPPAAPVASVRLDENPPPSPLARGANSPATDDRKHPP